MKRRLPVISQYKHFAEAGALMSYGIDLRDHCPAVPLAFSYLSRNTERDRIANFFRLSCGEPQSGQFGKVVEVGVEIDQGAIETMGRSAEGWAHGAIKTVERG